MTSTNTGRTVLTPSSLVDAVLAAATREDVFNRVRDGECHFSNTLAAILREQSFGCEREVCYAGQRRKKCDLRIESAGEVLYLEAKLSYPAYWKRGPRHMQRLFEPLKQVGSWRESHSAAQDFEKFATHSLPDATHVGVLILSSCTAQHGIRADLEELVSLADLTPEWIGASREIPNPFWPGYSIDAQVWIANTEQLRQWWSRASLRFVAHRNGRANSQ